MKNNPDRLSLISPNFPLELRRVTGVDTYTVIPLLDMNAKQSDRFSIYLGGSAVPGPLLSVKTISRSAAW